MLDLDNNNNNNNTNANSATASTATPVPPLRTSKSNSNVNDTAWHHLDISIVNARQQLIDFLKMCNCYDLMPSSGKIVVLDVQLPVKAAMQALDENKVRYQCVCVCVCVRNVIIKKLNCCLAFLSIQIKYAPLWYPTLRTHVGMITVTDFIRILLHFESLSKTAMMEELEKHQIKTWRGTVKVCRRYLFIHHCCCCLLLLFFLIVDILASNARKSGDPSAAPKERLISCSPEDSIYYTGKLLLQYRIHRVPVIDNGSILHIITHHELLSFVFQKVLLFFILLLFFLCLCSNCGHFYFSSLLQLKDNPVFSCTIEMLTIGTYKNIATAFPEMPLRVVLQLLIERRVSAVPVVNHDAVVIDVFTKSNILVSVRRCRTPSLFFFFLLHI
jgi:5'-AMP-activated protein kinase regulatory gamma subunit